MPPRVNKKLLLIIVGVLLVLVVVGTFWVIHGRTGPMRRDKALEDARVYRETGQKQKERFVYESWVARNPKDTDVRMKLAALLEKEGQFSQAYSDRNVIRHDPLNLDALRRVAYYEGQGRRWGEMRRVAKVVIDLAPTDAEARLYMARACLGLGPDYVLEALEHAREAVSCAPENIDARLTLAQVHQMRRAPEEVTKTLDEALKIDPKNPDIYRFLGGHHIRLGEREKAEAAYKAAVANATDPVLGHIEMGQFYMATADWKQAEEHFKIARDNATTRTQKLSSYTTLGDFYSRRGKSDEALAAYDEALVALPDAPSVLLKKARVLLKQGKAAESRKLAEDVKARGRRDVYQIEALYLSGLTLLRDDRVAEGIQELERALTTLRTANIRTGTAEINVALARGHLRQGNSTAARDALFRAYSETPSSPAVLMSLGRVLLSRREYDQTINVLNTPRKPHEGDIVLARAYIARGKTGDYREAAKALALAQKRKPEDSAVTFELARLAVRTGDYDLAHRHYDHTIQLEPGAGGAYLQKAAAYERQKKIADAETTYRRAVKALPDDPQIHQAFALFLSRHDRFDDGEKLLLDEINRAPENSARRREYEARMPRYYMAAGDVDKALTWYRKRAKERPKDLGLRKDIVVIELARGQHDEAAKYIEEIKAISGEGTPLALRLEGQLLVSQRRFKEALRRLKRAEGVTPNDLDVQYYIGVCLLRTGNAKDAQTYIERVASRRPDNSGVQRALAEVYYSVGNFEEAKRLFKLLQAAGQQSTSLDIMMHDVETKTGDPEAGEAGWRAFVKKSPNRAEGWIGLADALWRQGKHDEAITALRKGYELDKKSFRTTWSLANMYLIRKDFDKAIEVTNASLAGEKDNLALLGLLARLYELAGKPDDTEKAYARIAQLDPANPLPAVARADRALARNDLAAAEDAYREALRLRSQNRVVRTRLVDVLMKRGKPHEALLVIDEVLRETPDDIGLHVLKGRVLMSDRRTDVGIREFKEAIRLSRQGGLEKRNYAIHQELAEACLRLGRLSEARDSFRSARDLRPDLPELRLRLAEIAFRQGRVAEARAECLSIVENQPNLDALLLLAEMARNDRNYKAAKDYYRRAAEAFPDRYLPHAKNAEILLMERNVDEAVAELRKVVQLDNYSPGTMEVLVGVLAREKRYDEALTLCTESLNKSPEPSQLHFLMGVVEASRRRNVEARKHFDTSLRMRPDVPSVHLAKAQTYVVDNDKDTAVDEARLILKTDASNESAYVFIERIYRGDKDKVEQLDLLYREWAQNMPLSVIAANNYAWYLTESKRDPDGALKVVKAFRSRSAAARRPFRFSAELDDTEGMACLAKGRAKDAAELFKRSLAARRDSAKTWEHLRVSYATLAEEARKAGDEMAARRYDIEVRKAFARVRELLPNSFEMQTQLGDVRASEGKIQEAIDAYEKALGIKKDVTTQRKLADMLIRDGRIEEAKKHVEDLIRTDATDYRTLVLEARLLSKMGKRDKAIKVLEDVVKTHADDVAVHYILSKLYVEAGKVAEGRAELDKTIKLAPEFAGARLVKARLLAAEGKLDEAVAECKAVLEGDPMSFDAAYNMGNIQLAQKKTADAEKTFKAMKRRWPDSVIAHERLAETYRRANRLGEALLEFQDARRQAPKSLMILRGLCGVLRSQKKTDLAIREYGTFLEDSPQVTEAWIDLAQLYAIEQRWADAERAHKAAVKADRTNSQTHKAMADFYTHRKMFKEARDVGQRMIQDIRSKEGTAMGHTLIARNWELAGKADEAIQEYRLSMAADPDYGVPVNNLAWLLATTKGQPNEAIKIAEPYAKKLPGFAELHDTVGWAYRLADQPKKALPFLAHAVRLQVARQAVLPTILYHYGEVLYLDGQQTEAKRVLGLALKGRFPEYDRAKEIYDKIK